MSILLRTWILRTLYTVWHTNYMKLTKWANEGWILALTLLTPRNPSFFFVVPILAPVLLDTLWGDNVTSSSTSTANSTHYGPGAVLSTLQVLNTRESPLSILYRCGDFHSDHTGEKRWEVKFKCGPKQCVGYNVTSVHGTLKITRSWKQEAFLPLLYIVLVS